MLHQGKLKNWDPLLGTGFLQQDKAGPDIHISSTGFRKKPDQLKDGDQIFFQIEVDPQGKAKAVFAYKAGQNFVPAPALKKPSLSSLPFQRLLSVLVSLSILAWLGYMLSTQATFSLKAAEEPVESEVLNNGKVVLDSPVWPPINQHSEQFQCEGKQYCSEMMSCDEIRFYLENCPDVLIDRDNDGVPCKRQQCGY